MLQNVERKHFLNKHPPPLFKMIYITFVHPSIQAYLEQFINVFYMCDHFEKKKNIYAYKQTIIPKNC
jgi:hypothetical protein